ncbi:TPA: hypothetical protein HA235_00160 [Candidatus Woesearchaeota archaeon]|nr:hypothetical protein [Candidatus Woesearchaeota archaeon]HIH31098.1 hypothetical protein [Candidatus Woesearchaeota archaeon]HIH55606.1 hypothetical protein [Candidatus Woesearchaeota archaeon]HIJ01204.1 hypothetical protein [Candidatus Woesearchaeota archaeon]HIJ14486.1 hypothetical protein [Candidatus Woesearchaeota archaeon]
MSKTQNIANKEITRITKNTIVAIRMPKGLVDELKDLQKINHFMDLSDEIRFIIRKYCIARQDQPESIIKRQKLIEDLTKIIENLKGETQ